jgi:hypothetical protein
MISTEVKKVIDSTPENITVCVVDDKSLFATIRKDYPRRNVILRDNKYMVTYMIGISLVRRDSMLFIDNNGKHYMYKAS